MFAGAGFGLGALIVSLASAYILYKVADAAQTALESQSREDGKRIALLTNETQRLTADNLFLEKLIQPRRIPPYASLEAVATFPDKPKVDFIAPFPETPVIIQAVPDFEALHLQNELVQFLLAYKWKPEIVKESDTGVNPLWIDDGVTIVFPAKSKYRDAGVALAASLTNVGLTGPSDRGSLSEVPTAGINLGPDGNPVMRSYPHFKPPRDTVIVLIGMKPYPFKSEPLAGRLKLAPPPK